MTDLNPVDAMTTDYRALCAELAEELVNEYGYCTEWEKGLPLCESNVSELLTRARALLAQPEPEEEDCPGCEGTPVASNSPCAVCGRAVLARWGNPTPQPVAVSERWPEFSDCDPQERVWAWNPVLDHWKLSRINRSVHTHWLPANALPTPEAQ